MANIWHGATPVDQVDPGAYELGSVIEAHELVSLTGIRVHSPANAVDRPNRKGHVWSMVGDLLATVDMPEHLPAGWSTHTLPAPIDMDPGDFVVISYETNGNYSAIPGALSGASYISDDGAMSLPESQAVLVLSYSSGNGRFHPAPGIAPSQSFGHTWYAVDAEYTPAAGGGGTAPVITSLVVTPSGLSASAAITAADTEGLVGATYTVQWGDGTTDSGPSGTFSHAYAAEGIKALLVSVTDSTGRTGYYAGSVLVSADDVPETPSDATGIRMVMQALRDTLRRVHKLSVSLSPTGQINPPHVILGVPTILDYRKSFSGMKMVIEPTITILTSAAFDENGALRLMEYASPSGPKSIPAMIANNRTLSGKVEDCRIMDFRPLDMDEYGAVGYYGGIFTLQIMARA